MSATIIDQSPDILETFHALGIKKPTLAALLPRNIGHTPIEEFVYPAETKTLRKLLRDAGFQHTLLEAEKIPTVFLHERSADWIVPALFVAHNLSSASVTVYLNVLSAYLYDLIRSRRGRSTVKVDMIVETTPDSESRRISYCGDVSGLAELPKIVRELRK